MLRKLGCLLLALILLGGCARGQQPLVRTDFLLDTFVSITLYGGDEEALSSAFELVRHMEGIFSRHRQGSEVYLLNNAGGRPIEVSGSLSRVLEAAAGYSEISQGAFDVTIAPMMDLWFGGGENAPPAQAEIFRALRLVDYRNMVISGGLVALENGAAIDLGGIAKGYIADEVGQYLRGRGAAGALIDLGGDILAVGERSGGRAWRIGIRCPFEPRLLGVVEVRDSAVVTSGVYERYFMHEGARYHHIIDARTGWPADSGVVSVTVVSASAMKADALSLIGLLLGAREGMALIEDTPGAEAVFVTLEGEILVSSGLEGSFELV